ncbi:TonB-dependent receptor [Pseudomonas sp. PB120]|uniref:TonB-dependent receptor plug domain-containing protein n=1 Tax=Pseudomonas sp. PB120 TaxID=2494700 RepID=UPI0012FE3380|nr:TonB-dependent receptor [Pseudomonas sp. PB120]MVV50785.1 TonB-dependent receptor [Pseudomonas sp. PB120]
MRAASRFVPAKARQRLPYFAPCLLALALPSSFTWADSTDPDSEKRLDTVTVVSTGNRGSQRTVADSPAPIDVISNEQLTKTGKTNLKDILGALIPSLNFPSRNIGGTSWLVPGFTMRGLNGDEALVLVNGKRRHNTAVMNNQARLANGGTPVDLDRIPVSLIDHIEVLRDGASAQYGSDAIAGVINIILKTKDNGGTSDTTTGQTYSGDGFVLNQQTNYGVALPNDGFLNFSIDAKKSERTYRNEVATSRLYPLVNGRPDPREATADRHFYGKYYGNPDERTVDTGYNLELPLPDDLLFYSFSTFSYKDAASYTGSVLPNSVRNIESVYPNGFLGERGIYERDYQVAAGLKGALPFNGWEQWSWDASSTYGEDHANLNGLTGLAASFGPTSPTSFHLSTQTFNQWTNNLDFSRHFDVGLPKPLDVSLGVEHRREEFKVESGDPEAYLLGPYTTPAGVHPPAGGGIYSALTPDDAGDISRNSYAGYVDLGTNITEKWYTGLAGRFEHYDDASGNTAIGKLTTRYELTPEWAVRGTYNTGFRAPSLAQINYSTTAATATVNADGSYNQFYTKLLRPDSPEARALGAEPLKPEKSQNVSVGVVYQQGPDLRVTLDAYQIEVKDRIVQTGLLTGPAVSNVLLSAGLNPDLAGQYYTNAVDTRTRGVDLVGEYTQHLINGWGKVNWSAAYSWNRTTILDIANTPAQLSSLGNTLFDRQKQADLTKALPRDRIALNGLWSVNDYNVNLRLTRYGSYTEVSTLPINDRTFSPKWITDLEVSKDLTKSLSLALGANNLFDKYPDKIGVVSPDNGAGQYGIFSPFGINGGFYYTKVSLRF